MERLEPTGSVFVNTGGSTYEADARAGEVLKAEAGLDRRHAASVVIRRRVRG